MASTKANINKNGCTEISKPRRGRRGTRKKGIKNKLIKGSFNGGEGGNISDAFESFRSFF